MNSNDTNIRGPEEIKLSAGMDEVGTVFLQEGKIFRRINHNKKAFVKSILADEYLMADISKAGMIETKIHKDDGRDLVLEHKLVRFQTFWNEWTFEMLRDAALTTIDLTIHLIERRLCLKDAHPYNILFDGSKPVFVDFGSIVELTNGCRKAWEESFFSEFYLQLNYSFRSAFTSRLARQLLFITENHPRLKSRIGKYGRSLPAWKKSFPKALSFAKALQLLRSDLSSTRAPKSDSEWGDYYQRDQLPSLEDISTYTLKERSARECLEAITIKSGDPSLLDLASNAGWFSQLAAQLGYNVAAADYDRNAISSLYQDLGGIQPTLKITPVVFDILRPTPVHGLGEIWAGTFSRLSSDVVLAMALQHHLVVGQGVTFDGFCDIIDKLCKTYAVVEFIEKDDVHIREKVRDFDWYSKNTFIDAMSKCFVLEKDLPSHPSTRRVLLFRKLL